MKNDGEWGWYIFWSHTEKLLKCILKNWGIESRQEDDHNLWCTGICTEFSKADRYEIGKPQKKKVCV